MGRDDDQSENAPCPAASREPVRPCASRASMSARRQERRRSKAALARSRCAGAVRRRDFLRSSRRAPQDRREAIRRSRSPILSAASLTQVWSASRVGAITWPSEPSLHRRRSRSRRYSLLRSLAADELPWIEARQRRSNVDFPAPLGPTIATRPTRGSDTFSAKSTNVRRGGAAQWPSSNRSIAWAAARPSAFA